MSRYIQILQVSTLAGTATSAASLTVYVWATTGTAPSYAFDHIEQLQAFRRGLTIAGLPISFLNAVGFGVILCATYLHRRSFRAVPTLLGFAIASLILGLCSLSLWRSPSESWTAALGALAAVTIIGATINRPRPNLLEFRSECQSLRRACLRPSGLAGSIAVLIIAIASPVSFRAFTTQSTLTEASLNNFARWYTKQRAPSPDPDLVPVSGVRLVIFADYQCPSSASALPKVADLAEQLREETGESLEVVVRDFPIDSTCNPGYWASLHPAACEAAAAVRFLSQTQPDKATRAFVQWLRDNRAALTPSLINEYLSTRAPEMAARFDKQRTSLIAEVRQDAIRGLSLGVSRTPTFFVNGVKIPHPIYLESAVLLQLKREPYDGVR